MHDENHRAPDARPDFLTARQLAAYLQVSESTVHRLAREGRIPAVRLTPRLVRFHLPSVLEALDGRNGKQAKRRGAAAHEADDAQLSFEDLL
ncbi:MAG TPA: helix-turn-helix domain-containing protein [Pyrinomonadaceae bacterium]